MRDASLSIRRIAPDELDAYKRLRDASLEAHPEAFTSDVEEARRLPAQSYLGRLGVGRPEGGHFTLGAWSNGELVGALGCDREPRRKARHVATLVGMMVRGDCAGRGIGGALLDAALAEARRAEGLEMLTLSVTAGNDPAQRLYRRAGFVTFATLPHAIRVDGRYYTKEQMFLVL